MGEGHTWGESTKDKGLGVLMDPMGPREGAGAEADQARHGHSSLGDGELWEVCSLAAGGAGLPKRLHQNS